MKLNTALLVISILSYAYCDLPTNCTYDDTLGKWTFFIGHTDNDNTVDCSKKFDIESQLNVELLFPNKAIDHNNNVLGTWTMIYNQGFEVIINGKIYFAFQLFEDGQSICSITSHGWVHDVLKDNDFPPKNWGCYYGVKENEVVKRTKSQYLNTNVRYTPNEEYIKEINKVQNLWTASLYEQYKYMTIIDMINRAGVKKIHHSVKPRKENPDNSGETDALPSAVDWRNKEGVNYISPVRNQGTCGSCYAFASMALLEANVRIESGGKLKPVFSTQDVVSCSPYSQGCQGGFPYLVAGKFAQDFGVIEEREYPYIGNTTKCNRPKNATKTYVSDFGYIGDFYGGCSELLMRKHLAERGPLAVSIEVYSDLQFYRGGIYVHTGLNDKFNPWEVTNHVVLVVGYGEEAGTKYWIVKNSWGKNWGEKGFFRIRRGTDEVAIESMAVYAKPYVKL